MSRLVEGRNAEERARERAGSREEERKGPAIKKATVEKWGQ